MLVVDGVVDFFAEKESRGSCWSSSIGEERVMPSCYCCFAVASWVAGGQYSWSCCQVVFAESLPVELHHRWSGCYKRRKRKGEEPQKRGRKEKRREGRGREGRRCL
ncbi:hypothetical protein RDI58_019801 [Solanum bulbocastanum]|uniref:Uncharacterized protein n=1 Tax=Solanum bulbocastanum TaxID=147425 RepID=A0AAN8Y6W6_SOLBU